MLGTVYFSIFSAIAVLCALGLLTARHPISGALSLVGVMLSLASIYSLLSSPFLAVVQVLVYAGAIMMLVIFVIMVVNAAKDHAVPRFDGMGFATLILPIALLALLLPVLWKAQPVLEASAVRGTVAATGAELFDLSRGWYILFEAIGLLLLGAIVGAVALSKRTLDRPETSRPVAKEHP